MKFLVVEDTEDSRLMLVDQLEVQGYEVESAVNGVEALEMIRTSPPDIIISDIMMPKMDGFELCHQVKRDPQLKKIPFIFYTATYTDPRDEELALALGGVRFIIKPLEPHALMLIIQEVVEAVQAEELPVSQAQQKDECELEKLHLQSISRKLDKKNTELEKEREALKKSEDKYRHLVESIQNYYFFYTHDTEGVFTYLSPSIENLLGYTPEEFLVHYSKYLTDNPVNKEVERHSELSIKGEEQPPFELELVAKDSSVHWLEVKEVPVFDEQGNVSHIEGIAHDITERKQTEEALRRSQKMDALGKLTGGIAHDYNNMLGVILGYADLLESALSEQPQLAQYVHEITHAGERGAKLTRKLLSFSQQKKSETKKVNLTTLLLGEQHMLEKTLTARIKLILDLAEELWTVRLDDNDLEDAILNLSINAMHAIVGNGQLTIKTRNKSVTSMDAPTLQLDAGDYVFLSITDTGSGMDEATKEKIFDPFYTTKGENGTGLGLSQVYGFLERSCGVIKVYSEQGQGTRFELYFPRYHESDGDDKAEEVNNVVDLRGNETILVVDDEPALLDLISEILSQQGYHVICAGNAKQALEILEKESINLLFSDVIMPDMDGYKLAAIVQEKYPTIKIQLASGFSDNRHLNMIDDSLYQRLISKPYNIQTLLQRVRELLGKK